MNMQISDMIDRLTILHLKKAHGINVNNEIEAITKEIPTISGTLYAELAHANLTIWDLESEVGRMALKIREWNTKRTELKNKIAEQFGGFKDTKQFYATGSSNNM